MVDTSRGSHHASDMNCNLYLQSAPGNVFARRRQRARLPMLALLCLVLGGFAARADWPEFRGPWGNGYASAPGDTKPVGLPLHWSETNNVKWKTEIPYTGWSTPVVLGGQVWLTTAPMD